MYPTIFQPPVRSETLHRGLPKLDPGVLPAPYFTFGKSRNAGPSSIRDAEVEKIQRSASALSVPAPPIAPEELTKSGKPLSKKEKKAVCFHINGFAVTSNPTVRQLQTQTAGSDWFDLPAPSEADLPRMYREYEALRLRNQLDPKRFYRKEEGEGKGMKGLPKYFAVNMFLNLFSSRQLTGKSTDWNDSCYKNTVRRTHG